MKNKIFVFIVLAMGSLSGMGQYVSETVDGSSILPNYGDLSFVRNCPSTYYTVSFVPEDTSVYALLNLSFTTGLPYNVFPVKKIKMPRNIRTVTDMRAVDSIVFFCGYDTTGTCIIGFFDILHVVAPPALFYPPYMIAIYEIPDVTLWDKIAVFKSGSSYHVYAIGDFLDTMDYLYKNTIVEIRDAANATNYKYVHLGAAAPYYSDRIDDIVFTSTFIYFVGRDNYNHLPDRHITMRCVRKSQGLSASSFNNLHYYTAANEYDSKICAVATTGENFSIAYAALNKPNSSSYPILIRTFNMSMNNTSSSQFNTNEKTEMYGLSYNSGPNLLTVLHSKGLTSMFTLVLPTISSSYYALSYTDATTKYKSIDIISSTQFIATSEKTWYLQDISHTAPSSCLTRPSQTISVIPNLTRNTDVLQLNVLPYSITPVYRTPVSITTLSLNANCNQ